MAVANTPIIPPLPLTICQPPFLYILNLRLCFLQGGVLITVHHMGGCEAFLLRIYKIVIHLVIPRARCCLDVGDVLTSTVQSNVQLTIVLERQSPAFTLSLTLLTAYAKQDIMSMRVFYGLWRQMVISVVISIFLSPRCSRVLFVAILVLSLFSLSMGVTSRGGIASRVNWL